MPVTILNAMAQTIMLHAMLLKKRYIDAEWNNVAVIIIDIEHMTGKAGN